MNTNTSNKSSWQCANASWSDVELQFMRKGFDDESVNSDALEEDEQLVEAIVLEAVHDQTL